MNKKPVYQQKTNPVTFRETLTRIIKEEMALMREQTHPAFNRLGNRKGDFVAWIMRQYFDPQNNKDSRWYDPSVNERNVLDHLSNPKSNFPLSPVQAVDFFRNMKSLQNMVNSREVSADLDAVDLPDSDDSDPEVAKVVNRTGDVTLKDIGDKVGSVTAAMVNKIEGDGLGKLQDLTGGKYPRDFTPEDEKALDLKLRQAEADAAERFATLLQASDGNVGKFLMALTKNQIMSDNESSQITDNEIESLMTLAKMPKDRVIQILQKDLNSPNGNVIKTFQSMYSKTLFPPKKRGRKAKVA